MVGLQDGEYPDENKILDTVCTVHWAVSYAMGLTLSREKHLKVCIHSWNVVVVESSKLLLWRVFFWWGDQSWFKLLLWWVFKLSISIDHARNLCNCFFQSANFQNFPVCKDSETHRDHTLQQKALFGRTIRCIATRFHGNTPALGWLTTAQGDTNTTTTLVTAVAFATSASVPASFLSKLFSSGGSRSQIQPWTTRWEKNCEDPYFWLRRT